VPENFLGANETVQANDYNFDGYMDFRVLKPYEWYDHYIFNTSTKEYVIDDYLRKFRNLEFDLETNTAMDYVSGGGKRGVRTFYVWENNELRRIRSVARYYAEDDSGMIQKITVFASDGETVVDESEEKANEYDPWVGFEVLSR
jgi:hypothetical protein